MPREVKKPEFCNTFYAHVQDSGDGYPCSVCMTGHMLAGVHARALDMVFNKKVV